MVAPRREPRDGFVTRRLAIGFVVLVALSAGLMAAYGGATPVEVGLVSGFGLLVGVALLVAMGVGSYTIGRKS